MLPCPTRGVELSALLLELAALKKERGEIQAALTTVTAENATAEEKAAGIVAGLGIAPAAVPAAAATGGETVESLIVQMNAETDPAKKWALAEKINKLEEVA